MSSSLLKRLSTSPLLSLHARNFSTIHAASPTGESFNVCASVCGFDVCRRAYASSGSTARDRVDELLLGRRERRRAAGRADDARQVHADDLLGMQQRHLPDDDAAESLPRTP